MTKMRICFALGASIDSKFLEELQKDATVTIDSSMRILVYTANDGNLKLNGEQKTKSLKRNQKEEVTSSSSSESSSEEEDSESEMDFKESVSISGWSRLIESKLKLMKFVVKKTKGITRPLSIGCLATEYVRKGNTEKSHSAIHFCLRRIRDEVYKMKKLDVATRVRIIFGLSATVDEGFLNELRRNAKVKVDETGRITKYKANDGSLKLRGEHRQTHKREDKIDEKEWMLEVKQDEEEEIKPFDVFIENYEYEHEFKMETPSNYPQIGTTYSASFSSSSSTRSPPITYGELLKTVQKSTRCGNGIEFLSILSDVAINLKSPIMSSFVEDVKKRIQESEIKEMYIPEPLLRSSFDVGLRFILDHSKLMVSNDESNISLKEVLMVFRVALFNSNGYTGFKDELRRMSYSEKPELRVSYEKVRYGLEMAIEYAFP
ncbi:hypothetical protein CRE_02672 [Caenorhabditis remanei]|uniref:SPK domain-containing protein n=1 Tax=Caenorhabditis remanei TaxID=31234 RepID=E3NHX5_CAERE|nr:hypothetical protein CRE_02672 [Caenorhabditis remanei]